MLKSESNFYEEKNRWKLRKANYFIHRHPPFLVGLSAELGAAAAWLGPKKKDTRGSILLYFYHTKHKPYLEARGEKRKQETKPAPSGTLFSIELASYKSHTAP